MAANLKLARTGEETPRARSLARYAKLRDFELRSRGVSEERRRMIIEADLEILNRRADERERLERLWAAGKGEVKNGSGSC